MPRNIAIEPDLADLLIQIRRRSWRALHESKDEDRDLWLARLGQDTALPAPEVAEIEEELEATLPDAVLAVLCARVPLLEKWRGITLQTVPEFANQAWAIFRIERGLVPFGEGPIGDDQGIFCCYRAGTTDPDPEIFVMGCQIGVFPKVERLRLSDWLRVQVADSMGDLNQDPLGIDSPGLAPFRPRLVSPPPRALQRVLHATFGEGLVVESAGDRLTIEFAEHGSKRMLRKFVAFVD